MRTTVRLMLVGVLAGASVQALALPATCQSLGIQNNVAANAGCQIGTTNNDTINGANLRVNADQIFGYSNWIFAEKTFDNSQNIDVGFGVLGSRTSGLWFLDDNIWDVYSDVMLVLKGGNGNINPDDYVAYLLRDGDGWGSYLSPFRNGNSNRANIAHISVYLRAGAAAVPEPATLALIGIGLVGLAVARRRRSEPVAPANEKISSRAGK